MTDQSARIEDLEAALSAKLAKATEAMAAEPNTATIKAYNDAKKALDTFLADQSNAKTGERFKNLEQAASWVIKEGYIVSGKTVRNHAHSAGFPRQQKDGSYLLKEIAAYAATAWDNPSRPTEPRPDTDYSDQVKRETARKLKLDNDIKEGRYLLRSEEEQRDAQVLYGIKLAVENWGPFMVQDLISVAALELGEEVSARLGRITPELLVRYRSLSGELFDRFAAAGSIEVPDAD